MGFAEIIGHDRQLSTLRSALASNRLHHAYFFAGPEGVGKRTIAIALAKTVHCMQLDDDFCGQCVNCARISDGNHPDVRFVEPLAGKKEISIQQIRELERELNYRSFSGGRKIAVIDPATSMNLASQNALLKTLEEPPQDSLIILIAANAGALLPTVRSRCLRLPFAPLIRREVAGFLQAKLAMNTGDAEFLAALSMGSIGAAVNLDKDELIEKRRNWVDVLSSLKAGDHHAAMLAAEALSANRDDALKFLQWSESWYRDVLVHAVTDNAGALVNLDLLEQIRQQSVSNGAATALNAISRVADATAGIQRNLNRRMVLEKFLFGVVRGQ
ncbi:MAG TPA: DNA polymerase III subunit delta' [Verrucomicrobiae bacterium]|nr:DNA polymerase III subunit delta' [Verrucomicrobiae bacterium]